MLPNSCLPGTLPPFFFLPSHSWSLWSERKWRGMAKIMVPDHYSSKCTWSWILRQQQETCTTWNPEMKLIQSAPLVHPLIWSVKAIIPCASLPSWNRPPIFHLIILPLLNLFAEGVRGHDKSPRCFHTILWAIRPIQYRDLKKIFQKREKSKKITSGEKT